MDKEKQVPMFPEPPSPRDDENDAITARINAARGERMAREATKPGHHHRFRSRKTEGVCRLYCPSCGEALTIRLAKLVP